MPVLLVTYELDDPQEDEEAAVLDLIKKRHSWVRLGDRSYVVVGQPPLTRAI